MRIPPPPPMPAPPGRMRPVQEKIRQRRFQMVVHSYLYYKMDSPVVDDTTWQRWANELVVLQNVYPDECGMGLWDKDFKDWDGSTGMHLDQTGGVREYAEYIHKLFEDKH